MSKKLSLLVGIKKKHAKREEILWQVGKESFTCKVLPRVCPTCKAEETLVGLPTPILKKQPDDTNVVCHPGLGGCNTGFHYKPTGRERLYRQLI